MNSSRFRARHIIRRVGAPAAFVAATVLSFAALAAVTARAQTPAGAPIVVGIDFFYAIGSSLIQSSLPAVASVTDPMHVPILSAEHELIRNGNIIAVAYAPSYESQGKHAAGMAVQMLHGVEPSAMPIYRAAPADYKALINRRKMADLGLPVPASLDSCTCFVN